MKKVILNVSTGSQYTSWQKRLCNSLLKHNTDIDYLFWTDKFPPESPSHQTVPYAFKPFAFLEAKRQGYDCALWLDSPIVCEKPLTPIWNYLQNGPGYEFHHSWWKVGQWCSDAALKKHNTTRDAAMDIYDNWACIVGLNFQSPKANEFLDAWLNAAIDGVSFIGGWNNDDGKVSTDKRCMGHRHDQCISALICHKMGLERIPWEPPKYFAYHFQGTNDSVCLVSTR